jgi:sugar lactone lactonase YvrE
MTASGTISGLVPGIYAVMGRPVTVSSGTPVVYTATATGSPAIVSAGETATASVTYAAAEPGEVASVEVSPDPAILRLTVRPTLQLTVTPKDAAGQPVAGRTVTWQSRDPGRARVSETGVVSQVDSGFVTILAWIEGTPGEATLGFTHVVLAPDDATALCMDGSFSRNSTQAGACSEHQGLRVWLDDPPPVPPGSLAIITGTTGPSPDPDGYTLLLDGVEHGAIGVNATVILPGISPGSRQVGLAGVAGNCAVTGENPRAVAIMAETPATVTFAVTCSLPPAGEPTVLWVGIAATEGPRLLGYTAAQLEASTNAPPAIALTPPPGTGPVTGMAFDAYGNLWVADSTNNTVSKYTAAQLASGGSAAPAVVLSSVSLSPYTYYRNIMGPHGLAFDAGGNLWVANTNPGYYDGSTAAEFTPGQLATSGTPTPLYEVRGDYCGWRCRYFHTPLALAFDASGDLWVSDPELERLLMYPPDQLKPTPLGSSLPDVQLQDGGPYFEHGTDTPLDFPTGLSFDPAGNLWVSLGITNRLVKFTPSQLATGGFPEAAAVMLSGNATALSSPRGLAFDASGNIWVANSDGNSILEFTANRLASSGSPVPNVIVGTTSAPTVLAFYPHAANLPLK